MKCDEYCPPKCRAKFPACFELYPGSNTKTNPGNVQQLHLLANRVMPKIFDGIELDYGYRMSPNQVVTCNWVLSHTRPAGFRIGGIYWSRPYNDVLQTPMIRGDINPTTLSTNVDILYYPLNCLRIQTELQRAGADMPITSHITVELLRPSSTISVNLYNVRKESGRGTLSCLRAITDNWAVGAELLLEWTDPRSLMADTAFATRYTKYNYSMAASASRHGFDVSYWQRLHKNIQMASTLAWLRKTQKTIAAVCYQWDFEDAVVRGMFDSDLKVGFMYYRVFSHIPCGICMSLLISLPTNRFVFGLKFNLDPSGLRRGD